MWQLDGKNYWAEHNVVVPGDNLPEMFWNAVAMRGDMTLFRQKKQPRFSWSPSRSKVLPARSSLLGSLMNVERKNTIAVSASVVLNPFDSHSSIPA